MKLRRIKKSKTREGESLEAFFDRAWKTYRLPAMKRQERWAGWRMDFFHSEKAVAFEIEGGTWVGGGHNRGGIFEQNCLKYNELQAHGIRVFRFTTDMVDDGRAVYFAAWIVTDDWSWKRAFDEVNNARQEKRKARARAKYAAKAKKKRGSGLFDVD